MTKIDWKPIATANVKPFDAENWYLPVSRCIGANSEQFIGEMWYVYTSKGKGSWKAHGRIVYPTHWAEMPNLPD